MTNLIVDGSNVTCAAYFIIAKDYPDEDQRILAKEEILVKIHGLFKDMINGFCGQFESSNVFIAWEGKNGTTWRKEIFPEYKGNRGDKNELLIEALNLCQNNNYKNFRIENAEGDDSIYALCRAIEDDKVVISTDKDFIQLLQEFDNLQLYAFVQKTFRPKPELNAIYEKALCGDGGDNLKGLPGVGPVKAKKLIESNFAGLTPQQMEIFNNHVRVVGLKNNPYKEQILSDVLTILNQ